MGRSATRYSVLLRGTLDQLIMHCQQVHMKALAREPLTATTLDLWETTQDWRFCLRDSVSRGSGVAG
jgi:hypothetical protein